MLILIDLTTLEVKSQFLTCSYSRLRQFSFGNWNSREDAVGVGVSVAMCCSVSVWRIERTTY